jgi:hypothetical protein
MERYKSSNPEDIIPLSWQHQEIKPLRLRELAALRMAQCISGDGVEATVDAAYVLNIVEMLANKLDELITQVNNNWLSTLDTESKVNDLIRTLNGTFVSLNNKHNGHEEDSDKSQ